MSLPCPSLAPYFPSTLTQRMDEAPSSAAVPICCEALMRDNPAAMRPVGLQAPSCDRHPSRQPAPGTLGPGRAHVALPAPPSTPSSAQLLAVASTSIPPLGYTL